jgi:heparin lyase
LLVYPDNQIVDGQFCILGNSEPEGVLLRDEEGGVDGYPVYKFRLNSGGRRIELSTAFCTESIASRYPQEYIEQLLAVQDTYRLMSLCDFGDTVLYDWHIKFPNPIPENASGIISQWHGRPDKTLTRSPDGVLKYNSLPEMVALRKSMEISSEVNRGRGMDKLSGEENGWRVDSYQRPIGDLAFGNGYLYLGFRNDPKRLSDDFRNPKPGMGTPYTKHYGDASTSTVWEIKTSEIPINKWIHLRMEVKWATYSKTEDRLTSSGYVKFWFDDELVADWEGPIGKNDVYGPYFQFGVYTGGGNIEVHHSGYRMQILKKNTLIPFNPDE